jgi:hypothetical protein
MIEIKAHAHPKNVAFQGHPLKGCCQRAKTSPMHENEYFQPYLPATDIVTIAAISFSF